MVDIIYPSSWTDDINKDKLVYMKLLQLESRQVNIDFWEMYDLLKSEGKGKVPEEDILDEAYEFAKEKEAR